MKLTKAQQQKLLAIEQTIDNANSDLDIIVQELQEEYDDHAEKWQEGEKGTELYETIEKLQEAHDEIDSGRGTLYEYGTN